MKIKSVSFFVMLFLFISTAFSQNIYPTFQEGKFVYTVPVDFNPPMINSDGIKEIQDNSAGLKFPYYVVLIRDIYGQEDGDTNASRYINTLAEKWSTQNSGFNPSTSQIFILSYNPRKFRFLAGGRFEQELHFVKSAHQPFIDIFSESVKYSRKDPKTGIINMMNAVDKYLFENTDPAILKVRKEQALLEAERSAKERGRLILEGQISRLTQIMEDKNNLPADTTGHSDTLIKAKSVLERQDKQEMLHYAEVMSQSTDRLESYVNNQRKTKLTAFIWGVVKYVVVIGIIFGIFISLTRRYRKYTTCIAEFTEKIQQRTQKVSNAYEKYFELFGDKGAILTLSNSTGSTKKKYNALTKEIDDIYLGVAALKSQVEICDVKGKQGTFFNYNATLEATNELDEAFDFNTEENNVENLFEASTKTISIKPQDFEQNLSERFKEALNQWDNLVAAITMQNTEITTLFPDTNYQKMLSLCKEMEVPLGWLQGHPLAGNDVADMAFYDDLKELRLNDPIKFQDNLENLSRIENDIFSNINQIIKIVNSVNIVSTEMDLSNDIKFKNPQKEDPRVLIAEILALKGEILTKDLYDFNNIHNINNKYSKFKSSHDEFLDRKHNIFEAVNKYKDVYEANKDLVKDINGDIEKTKNSVDKAKEIFAGFNEKHLAVAIKSYNCAVQENESGKTFKEEGCIVSAYSAVLNAKKQLNSALDSIKKQDEEIRLSYRKKEEIEERIKLLATEKRLAENRIIAYGGNSKLQDIPQINTNSNSPVDYMALGLAIDTLQSSWNRSCQDEERRYEEDLRQQQQQREEDEARRERNSHHNSDSGNSWGSSSSSSSSSDSGGSWGSSDSGSSSSSDSGGSW